MSALVNVAYVLHRLHRQLRRHEILRATRLHLQRSWWICSTCSFLTLPISVQPAGHIPSREHKGAFCSSFVRVVCLCDCVCLSLCSTSVSMCLSVCLCVCVKKQASCTCSTVPCTHVNHNERILVAPAVHCKTKSIQVFFS